MSHLFLTGFMGAGKSTVGRIVADRLGLPFIDLDAVVEERDGRGIPAIFAESGEDAFRCAETDALTSLDGRPDAVVACGGGIVLRDENRALLRRLGRVYFLAVTAEEALARLGDAAGRPLLHGEAARLAPTLLEGRRTLYAAVADHTIDTKGLTAEEVATAVVTHARETQGTETTVSVSSGGGSYDAVVGRGLLHTLGARVRSVLPGVDRVAVVTDRTVAPLFAPAVEDTLRAAGLAPVLLTVPAGEGSKTWEQAGELVSAFAAAGLERGSAVVAVGGGVIGDLAGFSAAVYLRGIPVVQVPTTLLAQVDSSIGGKTGVDLTYGKNLVGAFWPPSLVLADTETLDSLPDAEWRSGMAEVVKSGVLAGETETAWLEEAAGALRRRDPEAADRAVEMCVAFKARVVSSDEREGGARECLNLGHTLGHAIEAAAGYGVVPHGLAVADGMRFAARLAARLGLADEAWALRQEKLLDALGLVGSGMTFNAAALDEKMRSDKKVRGGRVRFALALAPGVCEVREVDDAVIAERLAAWTGARG